MSGARAERARLAYRARSVSTPTRDPSAQVTQRDLLLAWWPLAASWLLMGLELPLVSAIVARLPEAKVQLAAFGGVVMPTALIIEAPVIMLLSASTALCRDRVSYALVSRFMWRLGLGFSALHTLVAWSPLYDWVVVPLLGVPEPVREPARMGLRMMVPWTIAIAYRRTQQGVLIRAGDPRAVSIGTAVRLLAGGAVLAAALAWPRLPGAMVGALAVTAGVVAEALFAGARVRPVIASGGLPERDANTPALTAAAFLRFYLPLSITPVILFLGFPISTAAMTRMPFAIESLAAWPAVNGLLLALRSTGFAFNEVVVSMLDRPGAKAALRMFASRLSFTLSGIVLLASIPIFGRWWFDHVSALPPELLGLAAAALAAGVPLPALAAYQSLYQGSLVHARSTRAVTESVALQLIVSGVLLAACVTLRPAPGVVCAIAALTAGSGMQMLWMWFRARQLRVA